MFLLVLGFAFEKHGLFELNQTEHFYRVIESQRRLAQSLEAESQSITADQVIQQQRDHVEANELLLSVETELNEARDERARAHGLIFCVVVFVLLWPAVLLHMYNKLTTRKLYVVPKRIGLLWTIVLGLWTLWMAILIAAL